MATSQSTAPARRELRQKLRTMRRDIDSRQRLGFDRAIRQHLLELVESRAASSLAAYWPFDGEPDMIPLLRQLAGEGVGIALPKVSMRSNSMEFLAWQPGLALEKSKFGILEPGNSERKSLSGFDILIVPLVGYDHCGNRLGMGAGYYDRQLESLRKSPAPLRVGIAYSLQEVEHIHHYDWDIPLHGVINENGWCTFGR